MIKRLLSVIIFMVIVGTQLSAKTLHPIFGNECRIIKSSCRVQVYLIDPIPVYAVEQVPNEEYIYDYKIMRKMEFKKNIAKVVTDAILDTMQYLPLVTKTCPFMGTYAVKYTVGKKTVTVVISANPCDKVIIFCPGSVIDKKHIDIKDNGTLLAAIRFLFNPVENKIPGTI